MAKYDDNDNPIASLGKKENDRWWNRLLQASWLDRMVFLVVVLLLTLIYSPVALHSVYIPSVGEIASRNVKADRDLLIEDQETTRKRREEVAMAVPPVYDWDSRLVEPIIHRIQESLAWLDATRKAAPPGEGASVAEGLRAEFTQKLEEEIPERAFQNLLAMTDFDTFQADVGKWLEFLKSYRVVSRPEVLKDIARSEYIIRFIEEETEIRRTGTEMVVSVETVRDMLNRHAEEDLKRVPHPLRIWLVSWIRKEVRPNLVLNLSETKLRRDKAAAAVEQVYFSAKRGEMLLREGEPVSEAARLKIMALNQGRVNQVNAVRFVGLAAMLAMFLWLSRRFLIVTFSAYPRDRRTTYLLGAVLLVVSFLCTVILLAGQGLADSIHIPSAMVNYLPPVALGAALTSLIVGSRLGLPGGAILLATVLSFLNALLTSGGLPVFGYHMIGSLVGAFSLRTCRRRFDVLRAGVWIGLAQMAAVLVVEPLAGNMPSLEWLYGLAIAMISGLFTGFFGLALIPLFEAAFDITTDSRLVELASGDHPLLKQLSLRAPGTYHHSVMMGNLTEAGAEAIGANPLMARVMALYHDIGKMSNPQYFVENQSGVNRHDQLSPNMSAKVIMSHIKKGVEMARSFKLGGPVLEAITQHQGTGLLQYFYNKALQDGAKRGEEVLEEEYRYPGPKPQSREAGILMLADSVEAAARSLRNPSPAQIHSLVKRLINHKIEDGQLDECKLTLREIFRIHDAFVRVLTLGFYHHRIEYPNQLQRRKEVAHGGNGVGRARPPQVAAGG